MGDGEGSVEEWDDRKKGGGFALNDKFAGSACISNFHIDAL